MKPLSFNAFFWRIIYKIFTNKLDDYTFKELLFVIPEGKK
jgi:hypothetical protein